MNSYIIKHIYMILRISIISGLVAIIFGTTHLGLHIKVLISSFLIGFFSASIIMSIEDFLSSLWVKVAFIFQILIKTLLYPFIILSTIYFIHLLGILNRIFNFRDPVTLRAIFLGMGLSTLFTFFVSLINILGRGVLFKLFFGINRKPFEQERIFLFLDMLGSTSIAEKIGGIEFLNLLNDFYGDMSHSISLNKAVIYKYVGDEIIITWKIKKGLKDANCIKCLFDIDKILKQKEKYYLARYGLIPSFKAGLHSGIAVAGHLGKIKIEIAYVGDVLNTTSRILSECANLGTKFFISGELLQKIELPGDIKSINKGKIPLKGKEQEVDLFGLEKI